MRLYNCSIHFRRHAEEFLVSFCSNQLGALDGVIIEGVHSSSTKSAGRTLKCRMLDLPGPILQSSRQQQINGQRGMNLTACSCRVTFSLRRLVLRSSDSAVVDQASLLTISEVSVARNPYLKANPSISHS